MVVTDAVEGGDAPVDGGDGGRVPFEPAEVVAVAVVAAMTVLMVADAVGNGLQAPGAGGNSASLLLWEATIWATPLFALGVLVAVALAWWNADGWAAGPDRPSASAGAWLRGDDRTPALVHLARARAVAVWSGCLLVVASAASLVAFVTSGTSVAGKYGLVDVEAGRLVAFGGSAVATLLVAGAGLLVARLALGRVRDGRDAAAGPPGSPAA